MELTLYFISNNGNEVALHITWVKIFLIIYTAMHFWIHCYNEQLIVIVDQQRINYRKND